MSGTPYLVQAFQEQEVDTFFLHFEKVATTLHWPQEALSEIFLSFSSLTLYRPPR